VLSAKCANTAESDKGRVNTERLVFICSVLIKRKVLVFWRYGAQ
jgi:hypothetical protein